MINYLSILLFSFDGGGSGHSFDNPISETFLDKFLFFLNEVTNYAKAMGKFLELIPALYRDILGIFAVTIIIVIIIKILLNVLSAVL